MAGLNSINPPFAIVENGLVGPGTARPWGFELEQLLSLRTVRKWKVSLAGEVRAYEDSPIKITLDGAVATMSASLENESMLACSQAISWGAAEHKVNDESGAGHCISPPTSNFSSFDSGPGIVLPWKSAETPVREYVSYATVGFSLNLNFGFNEYDAVYLSGEAYWPLASVGLDFVMRAIEFDAVPEEGVGLVCWPAGDVTVIESHFANEAGSGLKVTLDGVEASFAVPSTLGEGAMGDITIERVSEADAYLGFDAGDGPWVDTTGGGSIRTH